MIELDFSRCRDVWVPDGSEAGGFWSPPLDHVKVGVRMIVDNPYFLLADDMGGMKTAQAIISAQFLHDADVIDRVIVVAPASVRPKVWYDQDLGQLAEQTFDDKRNTVSEFHNKIRQWTRGPKDARELKWIVTNYEYIRSVANLNILLQFCGPKTMLILDESSAVRGHDSWQTDACMRLRWLVTKKQTPILGKARCGRILELNGTPVAESPMDMFSQGNLMHPSILDCKYVSHFRARYAVQEPVLERGLPMVRYGKPVLSVAGWSTAGIEDIQRRFKSYVLRREKKDFGIDWALPPVALEVVLTKDTWKHYTSMRDQMVVWLERGVVAAHQAGVKSMRLAQITSGFLGGLEEANIGGLQPKLEHIPDWMNERYGPGDNRLDLVYLHSSDDLLHVDADRRRRQEVVEVGREKLDFALTWHARLLERDKNLKLLTWCRFVPELRRYLEEVRKLTPLVGAACGSSVLGEGKKKEREDALRMLHPKSTQPGACTVGATQGTGALGLNFTACRTVLDMSYDFSPWKKEQGDSRVNRTGQTGPVSFFYLVAVGPKGQRTIDHHILLHRLGKINVNNFTTSAWIRLLKDEG